MHRRTPRLSAPDEWVVMAGRRAWENQGKKKPRDDFLRREVGDDCAKRDDG
jgi:hypothetical protein